jgi:hypothetical protein
MNDPEQSIWDFLLDRFGGFESAARRATALARYNLVHKKDIFDRDFREPVSNLLAFTKRLPERHERLF